MDMQMNEGVGCHAIESTRGLRRSGSPPARVRSEHGHP
ncbi:hypothetical protein FM104_02230 [Microbacterium esteraromaticum]|uniref:Uncharacterized protein n=1 Tax=Microbacterium esteraromaticum TaxID=57043 RepID=A0A1R4IHN3_9MICO|nr:hypothetical protein FM104_02230 [Microbacterium esteraromaticum]